jgi:hypothetical protein
MTGGVAKRDESVGVVRRVLAFAQEPGGEGANAIGAVVTSEAEDLAGMTSYFLGICLETLTPMVCGGLEVDFFDLSVVQMRKVKSL